MCRCFTQTWHATSLHSSGNSVVFNQTWHAIHSSGNSGVFSQDMARHVPTLCRRKLTKERKDTLLISKS
ncbi:MAG: hypothetical protein HDR84_02305 [Bacteroides sp.]|nr:hypothetical protein [Bacteroides sp.]